MASPFLALAVVAAGHPAVARAAGPPPGGAPACGRSIDAIDIAPVSTTAMTGIAQMLTATLAGKHDGAPVAGVVITFSVDQGPDRGRTATVTTDGSGQAAFTVTGATPGTDTVRASFCASDEDGHPHLSSPARIHWLDAPPPSLPETPLAVLIPLTGALVVMPAVRTATRRRHPPLS